MSEQSATLQAPDHLTGDSYADEFSNVADYAQEAQNRIAAQYRFAGLVAGIKGPNDTDKDVEEARNAVMKAIQDFLNPPAELRKQIDDSYRQLLAESTALKNDPASRGFHVLIDDIVPRGHPTDGGGGLLEFIADGGLRSGFERTLSRRRAHLDGVTEERLRSLLSKSEDVAKLETERRQRERDEFIGYFSDIWKSVKDYYEEKMVLVRSGRYLEAGGKILVDIAEVAHGEIVVAIISAAVIAATAGVTAVAAPLIRSAVALAIKVVKGSAGVINRTADKTRHAAAATVFWVQVSVVKPNALSRIPHVETRSFYERKIDVKSDLLPDERRLLNEVDQGGKTPTKDRNTEQSNSSDGGKKNDIGSKRVGDIAEEQARKDLADKGFTDQLVIQNPQGNGVDIIARNPETKNVIFGEVKANQAKLSKEQSFRGGPDFSENRLDRVINKENEWQNATPQQIRNAKRAKRWLEQNPDFKEIKYDVDRETGEVSNYRERDWNYPKGERPKRIYWRNAEGQHVTEKGKVKKQPARGPP